MDKSEIVMLQYQRTYPVPLSAVFLRSNPNVKVLVETDMIPYYNEEFGKPTLYSYCAAVLDTAKHLGITEDSVTVIASALASFKASQLPKANDL